MNPGPAMPADQPFVIDGRIWRRIVIALYLASSSAAVLLSRSMGHDLAWIPGLGWAANFAIVLAAIALARTDAPLRLQLALAFAGPVLFVVLRSGMAAYSGALAEESTLMLGLTFGWAIYSDLWGSVIAFGIALASRPVRPGVLLRTFKALGWVVAAAWLYILGFVLAANYWPEDRPYLEGLLWGIFKAATVIGWGLAPLWLIGAIAMFLSSFRRKQRPAFANTVVLILVVCLIGTYLFLVYTED